MFFLIVPYLLLNIGIPVLMTIPFYFFNKYLQKKIRPRESIKRLGAYFLIVILAIFVYITVGVFLIIKIAKLLQ